MNEPLLPEPELLGPALPPLLLPLALLFGVPPPPIALLLPMASVLAALAMAAALDSPVSQGLMWFRETCSAG